jgi:adenine-specific DNA-methyltransferase
MKQRLGLQWPDRDVRHKVEPRLLMPVSDGVYGTPGPDATGNMLIKGDNLLALKALEATYAGTVKCIYIDPPYNTGSAFTHYDDGMAHSLWLSLMRDRLEILCTLLRPDGIIFVSIDDEEHAYLKVLMDEIFGRRNFCGNIIWEKKKKPSFLDQNMGSVTENILCYSPDRSSSPGFIGGLTTEGKKYPVNNAGNSEAILTFPPRSVQFGIADGMVPAQDMSGGNIRTMLLDDLVIEGGTNATVFRLRGEWRYSQKKLNEIIAAGESLIISKIPFRPNHVKAGGETKKLKNLLSLAHYGLGTYEDSSAESRALFGNAAFDYPKPESLIRLLLEAVTAPGDLVLDSFAGSGTTGAVAHKMGRRWIMVEIGDHADTHIVPRLNKVIGGEDQGGVTNAVGWEGGGGFRYYTLAPSLLERDAYDNWVIAPEYNGPMLAQAMCKHLGFTYDPAQDRDADQGGAEWWRHGRSSERDFLYVTTQALTQDALRLLSEEVGPNRSLLICARAFSGNIDGFENLTCRKIPASILTKCEWGRDDYSLQIAAVPDRVAVDDTPDAGPLFAGAPSHD